MNRQQYILKSCEDNDDVDDVYDDNDNHDNNDEATDLSWPSDPGKFPEQVNLPALL